MARLALLTVLATSALAALGGSGISPAQRTGGYVSPGPAGTLVFLAPPNRLVAIDAATGRRTVRRVRAVASCAPQLEVTGGHVVFAGVRKGTTVVFSVPATLDRPPTLLGAAHAFVPSATPGRVWLAGVDCDRGAMAGVREVTVDGRTTRSSRRRVPGRWLAGAVEDGLVLWRERGPLVWDPVGPDDRRRLRMDGTFDTHGTLVAGCRPGSLCRELSIVDAATARTVRVRPGGRRQLAGAAFSPDGALLASPSVRDDRWSIALADTGDGSTTIVPGSRTGGGYPRISWAASTGWLFVHAADGRVKAYRPGAPRAVTLPIDPPGRALAFVAA